MSKYREKYFNKKGNFYDFKIGGSQFSKIKAQSTKKIRSTFIRGLVCGLFFESLIVGLPICKNYPV